MFNQTDEEIIAMKKDKIYNAGMATGELIRSIYRFISRHVKMGFAIGALGVIFFFWGIIAGKGK
jgi:hypothetical protein